MRRHADGALEGLVEHLAESGVCVDHHRELLHRGAGSDGVGALLDEVRGVDADDVHTKHLASVLVEEALGDAGALKLGKSLGVGLEGARGTQEAYEIVHFINYFLGNIWVATKRSKYYTGNIGVVNKTITLS